MSRKTVSPIYEIEIKNWEKYNPNKKHYHNRMMLDVGFLNDNSILNCTPSEALLYLCCLLTVARLGTHRCHINSTLMSYQSRIKPSLIPHSLRKLESLGLLTILQEPEVIEKVPLSRVELKRAELSRVEHTSPDSDSLPSASGKGSWRSLLEIYNSNRGTLPEAKAWNKDREKKAQARWKELPDEKQWVEVVKYYANSHFHIGGNDRSWVADFGFILQPKRWLEAAEKSGVEKKAYNKSTIRESGNKDALQEALKQISEESL